MVYAEFEGQTECIMGNWKIENIRPWYSEQFPVFLFFFDDSDVEIHRGYFYLRTKSRSCSKLTFSFLQVAIVGAPVTTWESYDTGYTERYMSTPAENPLGYKMSSVLNYASRFPDE